MINRHSNGKTRRVPPRKMTQMEAFDLLPPRIRDALQEGPQKWDTVTVLARYRRFKKAKGADRAEEIMAGAVWRWHREEIATGNPLGSASPHLLAQATMQLAGYST